MALGRAFTRHPPLLYVAGHDYTLRIFRGEGARYAVVSGADLYGAYQCGHWGRPTLFAARASRFMRLDLAATEHKDVEQRPRANTAAKLRSGDETDPPALVVGASA